MEDSGAGPKVKRSEPKLSTELRQQQALCTYKDTHLHEDDRLERALAILGDGEDLETTTDPETLGLSGAIHKRRWLHALRRDQTLQL